MASRITKIGVASLCTALLAVAVFIALTPPELASKDKASTPPQLTGKSRPTEVELPILNEQGTKLVMYLLMDDMKGSIGGAHTLLTADDTLLLTGIDLQTTAEQYDADYDANEVAADQKYKGKKILLTGVIESVNEDFKDDAYVVLKASNPILGVHAELNERGKAGASALAKGTAIYLVCDSGARIIGSAIARNCQQFSQHLDQIRPSLKSDVEKQLQEQSPTPTKLVQALRMMYVLGAQLPPDSPCFTGTDDACKASLAAIFEDKAKMQALADQIRRTFPAGASSNSPSQDVAQLMAQEDALDDKCRGGPGDDDATLKACDERELILGKIKANNWCWGHDGQIGADRTWEPCHRDNSVQQANPGFQTYANSRYGFRVDYPESFIPQSPPDNGDGLGFKSQDGKATLDVSGANNDGFTVKGEFDSAIKNVHGQLGYNKTGGSWFVVTWTDGDNIGYRKEFVGPGSQNSFTITFPVEQKPQYDSVVTAIEKSFQPGDLDSSH
jgi:hypothetical protein